MYVILNIIIIILIILIIYKRERFINIDLEGVDNLVSMFKDDKINLKNLEVEEMITCNESGTFGSTYIGKSNDHPNNAILSHKDKKDDKTGYALKQDASGSTAINSKGNVSIRQNDEETNGIISAKKGFFHKSAIGQGNHGTTWAQFSHKDQFYKSHGYSILQSNSGHTLLNSNGDIVRIRKNNSDSHGDIRCGEADIKHVVSDTTETFKFRPRYTTFGLTFTNRKNDFQRHNENRWMINKHADGDIMIVKNDTSHRDGNWGPYKNFGAFYSTDRHSNGTKCLSGGDPHARIHYC